MAREIRTTLFGKNNIVLEKIRNPKDPGDPSTLTAKVVGVSGEDPLETVEITKRVKSPLGFYYDRVTTYFRNKHLPVLSLSHKTVTYSFNIDKNLQYKLSYILNLSEAIVSADTRPWDFADTSIEDHFIEDLKVELDTLFGIEEVKNLKAQGSFDTVVLWAIPNEERPDRRTLLEKTRAIFKNMNTVKDYIYTQIFGSPKGYLGQTNEGKIISHGFDPKTSFRKRK